MYRELFLQAQAVRESAYVPYSRFQVGAALLTREGRIYTGVNIENAAYPVGLCAERAAFAAAVTEGEREFSAIAICGGREGEAPTEPCWPCGMCRQFIYEFAPELLVICGQDEEHLAVVSLNELLPKGFTL